VSDHAGDNSAFVIRRATLADYDGMVWAFADIDRQHAAAQPAIFRWSGQPARSRDHLAALIAREDAAILLAETDGKIVGLAEVVTRTAPDTPLHVPRRVPRVETLVVRANQRRRGIGRALMAEVEAWARQLGFAEIELGVWEFNQSAIAFYEQLGYTTRSRLLAKPLGGGDADARAP
jgi:ribosomal protein S18 acetylase RimI-like enzyme